MLLHMFLTSIEIRELKRRIIKQQKKSDVQLHIVSLLESRVNFCYPTLIPTLANTWGYTLLLVGPNCT